MTAVPQHGAAIRFGLSLALATSAAPACGGSSQVTRIQAIGSATEYEGWVTAVRGPSSIRAGERCMMRVQRTDHDWYNCRVRVRCGGELVYGFADSGYMRCTRGTRDAFVAGQDDRDTRSDGDPQVTFDLRERELHVADRDPHLELRVSLVDQLPPPIDVPEPPPRTRDAREPSN